MKTTTLALAVLLSASSLPLHAQTKAAPTCPCDSSNFKPLNDKARAVAEYWTARRHIKVAGIVSGLGLLFGVSERSAATINEAKNSFAEASAELVAARSKAEKLDGIKVVGGDDATVEIRLKLGVDYTLTP